MRLRALIAVALTLVPAVALAQSDPIAGAWEMIANKNLTTGQSQTIEAAPLHVIFSGGQYVQFRAKAGRAKSDVPLDKMTREQLLERSNAGGQYGTYRLSGSMMTRHIVSAFGPNNEGRDVSSTFKVEGGTLIITAMNQQGQNIEQRFKRLR